jgi:hypothetical protein
VRAAIGELARAHGFSESDARPRDIRDPVDHSRLLDVWHELTFVKQLAAHDSLIDDVRWALGLPKCVNA